MNFIPAQESLVFIRLFRTYVKWLFKRRFKRVWLHQEYQPKNKRTVYFLNHTSWWDGLIPFLLNEYQFHQKARAIMEIEQMQKYPFFKWLDTFSIEPKNTAHTLRSLRYAVQSMQRENASLFLYPEGEIRPVKQNVSFKTGIGWLYAQLLQVDFVPIGINIHTVRHGKPELHLWIGEAVEVSRKENRDEITAIFEQKLNGILEDIYNSAGFDDSLYEQFL